MASTAFVLLISHLALLALRWIPKDMDKVFWYFFPVHRRTEINIGSWALLKLTFLMLVTVMIKIPYDKWKLSHKFMGIFFILGLLHIYLLDNIISVNPLFQIYSYTLGLIGIVSWIYKSLLFDLITPKSRCDVTNVKRLSDHIMEVEMRPANPPLHYVPGQFYFFSFRADYISAEAHPFTVCSTAETGDIRIMVKVLGDFTEKLYKVLRPGARVLLEGPYGRFRFREGGDKQVWIGGGVGIVPFLSWADDLGRHPVPSLVVDLYYCVNRAAEATHLHVFKKLEKQMPQFRVHLLCADKEGFLKPRDIPEASEKAFYICGPKLMRKALLPEFKKMNISPRDIHFEDFDFT